MKTLAGRLLITVLVFLFFFGQLGAQQRYAISGMVTDSENNDPLPGATIKIQGTDFGVTTDIDGFFKLGNIQRQKITLIASYIGYKPDSISHDFVNNSNPYFEISLEPTSTTLEQVQVEGQAEGQVRAMIRQKEAENIINVMSAEQIEQFPDMNAAEAMQRIPGITLQRDQGEGRYVQLRGTPPEFTNFNINGEQIPSPEGGVRYVGMDVISADQIDQIEVTKVLTPDMDADGIGGTVNIITKKAGGDKPEIKATLAGGYNDLRQTPNYRAQFSYGSRYGKFGIHFNGSYFMNKYGSDNMEFVYAKGPLWGSTGDSIDNYYVHYREFQLRHYDITRTRIGLSATMDYEFNKNSFIYLRGMLNSFTDNETRRRKIYTLDDPLSQKYYLYGGIDHDVKDREKIQRVNTINIGGEHLVRGITIDYEGAYAIATEEQPNRMENRFESPGQAIAIKFDNSDTDYPRPYFPDPNNASNAFDWQSYEFDELLYERHNTSDENYTAKLNIKIPYSLNENHKGYFKFGGKTRFKHKERDIRAINYSAYFQTSNIYPGEGPPLSLVTVNDGFYEPALLGKDYYTLEYIPSPTLMNDFYEFYPQFFIIDRDETREDSFDEDYLANEDIYAGYAMFRHDFKKLMLLGGARYEKTQIYYEGREPILDNYGHYIDVDTVSDTRTHDFFLPQVQLKYTFNDRLNLRGAATYTFSRPNFEDVIPYREEDRDQVTYGNPDLKFPLALNLDLLIEKYIGGTGILSGGVFYKNIDNFIFYYKTYAHENDINSPLVQINVPLNGKEASVYGAEVQWQSKLDFLPGSLKKFGVFLNYTYTNSNAVIYERLEANYSDAIINTNEPLLPQISNIGKEEEITLPGQAKHAANLAFFYDSRKLYAKVSANYHDTFLYKLGADSDLDEFYGEAWHLDFTTHYNITDNLKVFADVVNLLDTPLKFYIGSSKEWIQKQEFYSWTARMGLKLSF